MADVPAPPPTVIVPLVRTVCVPGPAPFGPFVEIEAGPLMLMDPDWPARPAFTVRGMFAPPRSGST